MYSWAYWPLAAACGVAGIAGLLTRGRRVELPSGGRGLTVALAFVAVAAALQLLPVPADVLGAASPRRLELLEALHVPLALGLATTHGVSLDPAATIRALVLYAAFAVLTLGLARSLSNGGARRLVRVIMWIGVALAVTGIIQNAVYAGEIYGFWKPLTPGSHPFGPFVNKNHFAGWMLMAIPLALGYFGAIVSRAQSTSHPTIRHTVLWFASREANHGLQAGCAVLLMGLALAMTLSRSGMLSLALALTLGGYAVLRRQRGALARSAILGALALASVSIVIWAGTATLAARFASTDTLALGGRIPIWDGSLHILRDFWVAGAGLNTYGVATLFYPDVVPGHHLREAHNDYLQLAIEGGLLLCVPIVGAAVTLAVAIRRQFNATTDSTHWIRLGAVTGILAVAVQSVVEFSLQLPGNAAFFAILCAFALHRPVSPHTSPSQSPSGATASMRAQRLPRPLL